MMFMEDSEHAAETALSQGIAAGLHLNFTTAFTSSSSRLLNEQQRLAQYLTSRAARVIFHPGLRSSFEYVASAQLDEFRRLYGGEPDHVDGHHHMHLCANVLLDQLIPPGVVVRPHFSYEPGEKHLRNGLFRRFTRPLLARRYRSPQYFFSLWPLTPQTRLEYIFSFARRFVVEVAAHPFRMDEYSFLTGDEFFKLTSGVRIASGLERISLQADASGIISGKLPQTA
jgi:hypothetical protein